LKNGNLLRQQKNPDRLCMSKYTARPGFFCFLANTPRVLDFFASLHLTIFERPAPVAKWRSSCVRQVLQIHPRS
jgi:hypothetical protein